MQTRRWVNQSQPQTLFFASFLLYFNAFFAFLNRNTGNLGAGIVGPNGSSSLADNLDAIAVLFIIVGGIAAGYLIANERRIGYYLGIGVAAVPLVARVLLTVRFDSSFLLRDPVSLLFEVALVALILHQQSRSYVRLWFK